MNTRPSRNGSGLFLTGILLAVLGGMGVAAEANNHAVCDSTLGQLAQLDQNIRSSCSTDNALFYGGIVVLVAGSVMLVAGSIRLSRPPKAVSSRRGTSWAHRVPVGIRHLVALAMSGGGTAPAGRSRNTRRPCRRRRHRPRHH